ncbi:MAG: sigma 54-interacting transcriptional regulator, partial [Planctomycetes bacterium]|nr:sigma 54-interacting transcriptional regulator [Planctomycetota bacterium]
QGARLEDASADSSLGTLHPALCTASERWRSWLVGYARHWWERREGKGSVEAAYRLAFELEGLIAIARDESVDAEMAAWAAVAATRILSRKGPPEAMEGLVRCTLARFGITLDDTGFNLAGKPEVTHWLIIEYGGPLAQERAGKTFGSIPQSSHAYFRAQTSLSVVCARKGQTGQAIAHMENARMVPRQTDVQRAEIESTQGAIFFYTEQYDEALKFGQKTLDLLQSSGDRYREAATLAFLMTVMIRKSQHDKALAYGEESIRIFRELSDFERLASTMANLGVSYRHVGNRDKSKECYEESLRLFRQQGNRWGEAQQFCNLGIFYADSGKREQAYDYHLRAIAFAEAAGMRLDESHYSMHAAEALLGGATTNPVSEDDVSKAKHHLSHAHSIFQELSYGPNVWTLLNAFFRYQCACIENHQENAQRFAQEVLSQRQAISMPKERFETFLNVSLDKLTEIAGGRRRATSEKTGISFISPLIGDSAALKSLLATIDKVAASNVDVLILGETGSGKELVARAIHQQSNRASHEFVAINCGALPETLLESELFGHEKGAFTGADTQKTGLMETASGGTLFLDEIGEMPLSMQVKLLRALQERTIRRVGGTAEIKIDVRVIAATMRDLDDAVRKQKFRQDLYYRINVMRIDVPPLRERKGDIGLLAQHFVEHHAKEFGGKRFTIAPEALLVMKKYDWPGNVRELANAIRSAMATASGTEIGVNNLPETLRLASQPSAADMLDDPDMLKDQLKRHKGNVAAIARELGVARNTLYAHLKRHGISSDEYRA